MAAGVGHVPAPVAPVAAEQDDAVARVWVLAEPCGSRKIGEIVVPPAGHPLLAEYGLMQIDPDGGGGRVCLIKQVGADEVPKFCEERVQIYRDGEAADGDDRYVADDIRTMSVRFTAKGERRRGFKETVDEFTVTEMDGFPYEPRTCLPYLQAVKSVAESSYGQHLAWKQQSRIPEGSRAIYEDETLSHILGTAVTYDCLAVPNLACFELLVRRKQLIAEAHSYNPASPSYDGADHWLGNQFKPGGAIVVPALTEHVAKKMQAESQIMKERCKLEEAKGKAKGKPPKGPKGSQAAESS